MTVLAIISYLIVGIITAAWFVYFVADDLDMGPILFTVVAWPIVFVILIAALIGGDSNTSMT